MAKTSRGVYRNLKESTYIVTNGEINFFFSSTTKLGKFLVNYKAKRQFMKNKLDRFIGEMSIKQELLADVLTYEKIEKEGLVTLNGKVIEKPEIEQYIARFFSSDRPLEYYVPASADEIKQIRSTFDHELVINDEPKVENENREVN